MKRSEKVFGRRLSPLTKRAHHVPRCLAQERRGGRLRSHAFGIRAPACLRQSTDPACCPDSGATSQSAGRAPFVVPDAPVLTLTALSAMSAACRICEMWRNVAHTCLKVMEVWPESRDGRSIFLFFKSC